MKAVGKRRNQKNSDQVHLEDIMLGSIGGWGKMQETHNPDRSK